MEGLIEEGAELLKEDVDTDVLDAGLIAAAQKVEHYEIATYGGLTQLAKTIGREDVAELLGETLGEEKTADELLTEIAESHINYEASTEEA